MINYLLKPIYRTNGQICKLKKINMKLEQIPAKLHDFADKDLLQPFKAARFLFGKVFPPYREAR